MYGALSGVVNIWCFECMKKISSVQGEIMCYGHVAAAARHQSPINPDPMGEAALLCSKFSNTNQHKEKDNKKAIGTSRSKIKFSRIFYFFSLKNCHSGNTFRGGIGRTNYVTKKKILFKEYHYNMPISPCLLSFN